MFSESEGWDSSSETSQAAPSPSVPSKGAANESAQPRFAFHSVGESGFRPTASTPPQSKKKKPIDGNDVFRQAGGVGGVWGGSTCHCLQCSMLRLSVKLAEARQLAAAQAGKEEGATSAAAPAVVVLVDLDNFGFNHFKQEFPLLNFIDKKCAGGNKRKRTDTVVKGKEDVVENEDDDEPSVVSDAPLVFFWCLFGSLFETHYKTDPARFAAEAPQESIWGQLHAQRRLMFTPAGAHPQAVDDALVQMVGAASSTISSGFSLVSISCDKHLVETLTAIMKQGAGATDGSKAILVPQGKGQLRAVAGMLGDAVNSILLKHKRASGDRK